MHETHPIVFCLDVSRYLPGGVRPQSEKTTISRCFCEKRKNRTFPFSCVAKSRMDFCDNLSQTPKRAGSPGGSARFGVPVSSCREVCGNSIRWLPVGRPDESAAEAVGIRDLLAGAIVGIVVVHDHAGTLRQSCAVTGYQSQAFSVDSGTRQLTVTIKEFPYVVFLLLCVYVQGVRGNHGMSGALSHSLGNFLPCCTDTAETFAWRLQPWMKGR